MTQTVTEAITVHTVLLTKIHDFPWPHMRKIFQDLFEARECINIKTKMAFTNNIQSEWNWQNSSTFHTVFK